MTEARNEGRPWLTYRGTIDDMPEDARALHSTRRVGNQTWSGALVLSTIPEHYVKLTAYVTAIRDPSQVDHERLSMRERVIPVVIVSALNQCTHCLARNMADLRAITGDPALVDVLAMNWRHAGLVGRELALAQLAEKLTLHPALMSADDVEAMRAEGFTDEATFEALEIIATYNLTTRLLNACGAFAESEFLASNR